MIPPSFPAGLEVAGRPLRDDLETSGRLTEIGNLSALFPHFEALRLAAQSGQDRGEFRIAVPPRGVPEVFSARFTDTVTRWTLPQIADQPPPFALGDELSAKLELILGGLVDDGGRA